MADQTPAAPVYDPKLDALARQPRFADAYDVVCQAVQTLRAQGFAGTINVPGGILHVR